MRTRNRELPCVARRFVEQRRRLRAVCLSRRRRSCERQPQRWFSLCEGALVFALLSFNPFEVVGVKKDTKALTMMKGGGEAPSGKFFLK